VTVLGAGAVAAVGLPLFAALANGANALTGGRFYRPSMMARVAVAGTFGALVASVVVAVAMVAEPGARQVVLYRWLTSGALSADFAFLLDPLSVVMMLVVTAISWLVTRFSVNYMHNEEGFARYFTVVPLFVFAMLILVMADNYLLMFLGWEGVGMCSYLLISFYRERPASARAGTRAFIMNRVGDADLLVAMFLFAVHAGSFRYGDVFSEVSSLPSGVVESLGFLLLFGAVGKSAQLPLGTWLARAMEGPTPSSALIHAATMVTAGVYLIVRSAPLYDEAPTALLAVGIIGAATVLYAQLVGYVQTDVKGMLAASTVAQLGMMFVFCGLGLYTVAIFHLVVHAFYKSYLFLTAPSILHHLHGGADPTAVRRPGDTAPALSTLVLATAAVLMALPLLARMIPDAPEELERNLWIVGAMGVVAVFAAVFSTYRMVKVTFTGHTHGDERQSASGRLLGPVAVVVALIAVGVAVGVLPGGLEGSWFHRLLGEAGGAASGVPAGNPVLAAVFAGTLALLLVSGVYGPRYLDRFRDEQPAGGAPPLARRLYWGGLNRGYLDEVYERTFVRSTIALGRSLARFDRRVIDRTPSATTADQRSVGRAGDSWQAQFDAVRRAHAAGAVTLAEPPARLDWLPATPPSGVRTRVGAGRGGQQIRMLDRVSDATTAVERVMFEHQAKSGSSGLMDGIARLTGAVERVVFQGSLERGYSGLTHLIATFTEAIERLVFQSGVERTVARTTARSQRSLLAFENRLGRPWVSAVLVCLVLIALAVGSR